VRLALGEPERLALRDAQRAWIKRRDDTCRLATVPASRAAWLAELAQDYAKTVCVVRFTNERARDLEGMISASPSSPPARSAPDAAAPRNPAPVSPPIAETGGNVYDLVARTPRSTGKWYFETAVKPGDLARTSEQALFIGVRSNAQSIGTLLTLHKRDVAREPVNIGVAVDLDAGKLYIRENGAWRDGTPGDSGGQDLKLGRPYFAFVTSSAALDPALRSHSLEPNFGQQPFVYAVPDGYRPIDSQPPLTISER
jgi:hypothetical protein